MAKKTILLLLALCLLGGLSALVYGRDELDETSIDRFPESFVSYMLDIWNCTWGDTFDDIEVPEDLVQNFTEASRREFYAACYNQVWNELDPNTGECGKWYKISGGFSASWSGEFPCFSPIPVNRWVQLGIYLDPDLSKIAFKR